MVALGHEGYAWVPWFNCQGLTVAVVDYTLPEGNPEKPMTDVREAFEILADSASAWGLDPTRIGIMGSSAGGHLASTMATHPAGRCRPAFQILFYPVISLGIDITHGGTRQGFIGPSANQRLVEEYSSENKVTPQTPPAIMLLSADDQIVSPDNSIRYFQALTSNGVPASLMIYPSGGHGWGYNPDFKYFNQMLDDLGCWIRQLTPSGQINQTYAK